MWGDTVRDHSDFLRDEAQVLAPREVDDIVEQVLKWESDADPDASVWDSTADAKPGHYDEKEKRVTEEPSWRLRFQVVQFSYIGLIDAGNLKRGMMAEKLLMALTDRRTSALERMGAGDWQVLAWTCEEQHGRTRQRRVANPDFDEQNIQYRGAGMYTDPSGKKAPTRTLRVGIPDSTLAVGIVWYDRSHDVEVDPVLEWKPKGGIVSDFIRTGKLPRVMRIEREDCVRVMTTMRNPAARAARLPVGTRETIRRMRGKLPAEDVAAICSTHPDIVGVVWNEMDDAEDMDREAAIVAAQAATTPRRVRKPREA